MKQTPTKYKKTDVGNIPADWETATYGEVFDFLSTLTNSRADLCERGDFGYIHYGDVHTRWENNVDLKKSKLPEIKQEKIKASPSLVREGDLIVVGASEDYGSVAKSVEVTNIGSQRVFSGSGTFLLRDKNCVFAEGIRGYIHTIPVVKKQIQQLASGLKVFGVPKSSLRNVIIPIPTIDEQKAIATALSDVDGLIENIERLIAKKRDVKTAAMQVLLTGKKRLAGVNGDFRQVSLDEICKIQKGDLITRKTSVPGNIPVVAGGLTPSHYHNASNRPAHTITISASGANAGYVALHNKPIFASDCSTIIPSEKYDVKFLYYSLKKNQLALYALQTGGAQPHVYPEHLRFFKITYVHNVNAQKTIASILSDMDAEIEALQKRLAKTKAIKTAMMQELLTGKTRLVKP